MSAETLRRAAAQMRMQADAADIATTGTWLSDGNGPTMDYIASWHPAVALAVADWLDDTARLLDAAPEHPTGNGLLYDGAALAVARAYLGESA